MGFERLLSHIGDDYGEETEEKAAERIFKKITKVKKVQSTTHKKSLAAIAKIRKQNEARFRTQVSFVFLACLGLSNRKSDCSVTLHFT